MEDAVKSLVKTKTLVRFAGGGGCVNEGVAYTLDDGSNIYVKHNAKSGSRRMFDGEAASLKEIRDTKTITAPAPIAVGDYKKGAFLVTEYVDMNSSLDSKCSSILGRELANLHLHNRRSTEAATSSSVGGEAAAQPMTRFGFDTTTCCGFLPLDNEWSDDWVQFYCRQRLGAQLDSESLKSDREAHELWGNLLRKIPSFFKDVDVCPALVHGDLWKGNVAQTRSKDGASLPVIFDPASFFGHSEFEFGIINMFGGFDSDFFDGYHSVNPKAPGFEKRVKLYELFHHLNHWNHFGSGYRGSSISLMRRLIEM